MQTAAAIELDYNVDVSTIAANVRVNSRRDLPWLKMEPEHGGHAVIVGGGPSINRCIEDLRYRADEGQTFFAVNGSARWLADLKLPIDYHVLLDARPENVRFVLPFVSDHYLISSQCTPGMFGLLRNRRVTMWHAHADGIEGWLPETRPEHTLIASGSTVLLAAMCIAYAKGFRKIHVYGADSSFEDGHHAYPQAQNDHDEVIEAVVSGRTFKTTPWMAAQAQQFQRVASELSDGGATITVHGDGLLPWVAQQMTQPVDERAKYERMWAVDAYREYSPGEQSAATCIEVMRPDGAVIDFGCGTGRGGLALSRAGLDVTLVDFADNCLDAAAAALPFVLADLTKPIPACAPYGYCTDVMEHIPPADVEAVIRNVMASAPTTFFQISTVADGFGAVIGHPLHLTVQSHCWWFETFSRLGYSVTWCQDHDNMSQFLVRA